MATNSKNRSRRAWLMLGIILLAPAILIGGGVWWYLTSQTVYIDQAQVQASEVDVSPQQPGVIEAVYVNPGDTVLAGQALARVGDAVLTAKVPGLVIATNDNIGQQGAPGQAVVSMIDPGTLRIVGHLDENKGLTDLKVGDRAEFTVDAFGGEKFSGVVDEISPTSRQSGIVFNISDQRQVQQFDVKVRFDTSAHPDLKNGMSARLWIFKN